MITISMAKYDEKENAVAETQLKSFSYWNDEAEEYFEKRVDLPVYAWFSDEYNVQIIAVTASYEKEYRKIID